MGTPAGLLATPLFPERGFPLLLTPATPERPVHAASWIREHRAWLEDELLRYGSVLFRGFDISSVERFEELGKAVCPELFAEYGDLPALKESKEVYGVTPFPPHLRINFHNEGAPTPAWPIKQMFCAIEPAPQGGESTISDGRAVIDLLGREIVDKFTAKGITYVRNFYGEIPFLEGFRDVTWQEFFRTNDREEVVARCRKDNVIAEWHNDILLTRRRAIATIRHPKTRDLIWFNQILLWSLRTNADASQAAQLVAAVGGEDRLPRHVTYGDGERIEDDVLARIQQAVETCAVSIKLQRGEVLVDDNIRVAHAREPYSGPRKLLVAMGEMMTDRDLIA